MTILRIIIGCILGVILIVSAAFSETYEQKVELYNKLEQAVNDPNIILFTLDVEDAPVKFWTEQQLVESVKKLVEMEGKSLYRYHTIMEIAIDFSNLAKKGIIDRVLPQLRAEINSMDTYQNNSPTLSGESFLDTLENLNSGENLNPLAYENVMGDNSYDEPFFGQCPEWRPDNLSGNKYDTNNNPNDTTYNECNYFKDGRLSYQMPYVNGKKEGTALKYINSPLYMLAVKLQYSNNLKNGTEEMWSADSNSGHIWRSQKNEYTDGKKHGEQLLYHQSNGVIIKSVMYNHGRATSSREYDKNGKELYFTTY